MLDWSGWQYLPPKKCPICDNIIGLTKPEIHNYFSDTNIEFVFKCLNHDCAKLFIAYYAVDKTLRRLHLKSTYPESVIVLPDYLKDISNNFIQIYQEAITAEKLGLKESAGAGYRKAFEFLIKDYANYKSNSQEKEKISKMTANQVVEKFFDNPKLNEIAKRTLWLGNDEIHYFRKWDKNIEDLKNVIEISLHYIEMEYLANKYISEMPDGK